MSSAKFLRRWLTEAFPSQKSLVALTCVLSLMAAVLSLAVSLVPWFLHESRSHLLGFLGVALLARAFVSLMQDRLAETLAYKAMVVLTEKICRGFVDAPFEVRQRYGLAEFLFLFNQTAPKLELIARELPKALFTSVPTVLALLVAGLVLKPVLVLVVVALMALAAPAYTAMSRNRAKAGRRVLDLNIRSQKRLRELGAAVGPLWGLMSQDALRRVLVSQDNYLQARRENHHKINGLIYAGEFGMGIGLLVLHFLGLQGALLIYVVVGAMVFHFGLTALRQMGRLPISLRELEEQVEKLNVLYGIKPPEGKWEGTVSHLALINAAYAYPTQGQGEVEALKQVSLSVSPGRLTVITGKNGAGKSTLLRLLSARLTAKGGELRVNGAALSGDQARLLASQLIYLPQDLALPEMSVEEHLDSLENPRAMLLARTLGLLPLLQRAASADAPALSRGELQKVMVLKALFQKGEAYFLDEWDTAMDETSKQALSQHLRLMAKDRIVVCVTHDESLIDPEDRRFRMDESGNLTEG